MDPYYKIFCGSNMTILTQDAARADHIVAVYQGGGLCDLENLRTLCVICHQVGLACFAEILLCN